MKSKLFFLVTILTVLCYSGIAYAGEEITLTTYYPAPYGEYNSLSVGDPTAGYTATNPGELLVQGNVGIGTTSPGTKLDVRGRIHALTEDTQPGSPIYAYIHTTDGSFTNPSTIAKQSPLLTLTGIFGDTGEPRYDNTWTGVDFASCLSYSGFLGARIAAQFPNLGSDSIETNLLFLLRKNDTLEEKMRITANGNVGIGTTGPQETLHIYGAYPDLLLDGWAGGETPNIIFKSGRPIPPAVVTPCNIAGISSYAKDSADNEEEYASISFQAQDDTNGSEEGAIRFRLKNGPVTGSDSNVMYILGRGNVGIGTTEPAQKLHIAGGRVQIDDTAIPMYFKETDQTGAGSLWRLVLDSTHLRFDSSDDGIDFSPYKSIIALWADGQIKDNWGVRIDSKSDIRFKKDIITIPNALEKVLALRGVNFRWKDSDSDDGRLQMGLIAQEVEKVVPEIVGTADDEMETKGVGYQRMVALLVEAIKEQQKEIDNLEREITELTNKGQVLNLEK